ncbi:MAG: hypothetical protein WA705_27315 [Candidatus Ozemobacteraceae bacterium]
MRNVGRNSFSIMRRWFLVVILVLCHSTAFACNDSVLLLISGEHPSGRFASRLLDMARRVRLIAADFNAFNHEAARQHLNEVMKQWVSFTGLFKQSPPPTSSAVLDIAAKRVEEITDHLGVTSKLIDEQKLSQAHDRLEPLVNAFSLLAAGVAENPRLETLLAAERDLFALKCFEGTDQKADAQKAGIGLEQTWAQAIPLFSAEDTASVASWTNEMQTFRGEFLASQTKEENKPQMLSRLTKLIEHFSTLRERLVTQWGQKAP